MWRDADRSVRSEEPIVYVNGNPYCLRVENLSLRNMKVSVPRPLVDNRLSVFQDYGGIAASRLEMLEERLKNDVEAELEAFDSR